MKIKFILFLWISLLSLSLFYICSNANNAKIYDSTVLNTEDINTRAIKNETLISPYKGISLLSLFSLNDNIEVKSLYTDENNYIKALLFSYSGTSYPESLSLTIDGYSFKIDSTPDEKGYVYAYFDCNIQCSTTAEIYFTSSTDITDKINISPIKIVTTNESWTTSNDGHILYFYEGDSSDLIIPNFYKNEIITDIGGYISNEKYYNILNNDKNKHINSINISEGIVNIGNYAFYQISGLSTVTMPDTINIIGGGAFAETTLTGDIIIPENTKEIYAYAFGLTNITSITFNNKLERLCSYAFSECHSLNCEIIFPDSLYYLGSCVFYDSAITGSLTIPGGITNIGIGAFFNCPNLNGNLILKEGIEEIGELAFGGDGKIVSAYTSLSLPTTLKKIGPYAFQYCTKIPTITLPEGLEIISDGAFDHMSGITDTKMIIPSTVTTIGGDYIVEENTGYGGHIFYDLGQNSTFKEFEVANGNKYFTSVDGVLYSKDMTRMLAYPRGKEGEIFEVPEGITQIDEMAFSRACNLKKLILPDSYVITTSLPKNILNQEGNSLSVAIYVYTTINEIAIKETNENYTVQNGILYSKDMTKLYYVPNKYIGEINIPNGVTTIEKGAMFAANKNNTGWTNILIPETIVSIDSSIGIFLNDNFKDNVIIGENPYYEIDMDTNNIIYYGDVNLNFKINKKDIALMLKYISGISTKKDTFNKKAADFNKDGKINLIDVIAINI